MKQVSIIGVIFIVVIFILLKVFQDSIPRISEPITNILVFVVFIIFMIILGLSKISKRR
jgi:quinol-cytochrome oxidoreductase complex cytochrome b subunit